MHRPGLRAARLAVLLIAGLLVLAALPAVTGPAAAQRGKNQEPAQEDSFFGSVDVNVVTVEVFVTDKDGKFVPGLTQADFEILEDGKPVEITNFYVAQSEAPPAAAAAGEPAAPAPQAAKREPLPPEQRLYLTLFFDNQSLIPPARNRIIKSLKDFVRTEVRPDDNVMIVSYEGAGSMKVRQVSGGPEPLVKALDEVAQESTGGMDRQMAFREVMRTLDGTQTIGRGSNQDNTLASAEAAAAAVRAFGEARHNEIRNSLKALGGFVDGLSGLPGRKALLYVSGGNSLRPAETLYESWLNRFGALAGRQVGVNSLTGYQNDLTTRFREIGERANANRVTFYTLGATSVPSTSDAETPSADSAWTRDQEVREVQNLTQSLLLVAAPTGGLASIDPTEPGVFLRQMREDFEHFYSLGYAPADRKTPGNHRIEVRVKRPGLKVRHREGYRDRTTRDRLNHQAMAALLFGSGDDNPLEVGVLVEAERPAKRRKQREISLLVTIPMANLVLLPQEKVHEGKVTLLLGARDSEGRSSDLTQIDIPVRVPQAQLATAKDQSVAYRATLSLRDGRHTVVVGVRDEYGNVNSTLTFAYGEAAKRARSGR